MGISVLPKLIYSSSFTKEIVGVFCRQQISLSSSDPVFTTVMDVFSEQLDYDQSTNGYTGVTPQYNGNIASLRWQTRVPTGLTETQEVKGYVFTYDPLNRLTNAASKAITSGANIYNEALTYDELGNILSLIRNNSTGATPLNSMTYNYMNAGVRGNQLMSIANSTPVPSETQATSYTYNTNGSLITDSKKTLATPITYNELNMPSLVTFTTPAKTVAYNYDATGKKLERVIKNGGVVSEDRIYDDGIEYSGATASTLELVQTPEGRAIPSGGTYNLQYELTDHLGNVRAMFTDVNKNGILTADEILRKSDYYAFGREITPGLVPSPNNNYKYNKKEFQTDLGELDYGARYYDPVTGRWTVIDPMGEVNRIRSPYNYGDNNPIRMTDPDGMESMDLTIYNPDDHFEKTPSIFEHTGVAPIDRGKDTPWKRFNLNESKETGSKPFDKGPNNYFAGNKDKHKPKKNRRSRKETIKKSVEYTRMAVTGITKSKEAFELFGFEKYPNFLNKLGAREGLPLLNLSLNYIDVKQGTITEEEYEYKQTGVGVSFGIGTAIGSKFGGFWGVIVGTLADMLWEAPEKNKAAEEERLEQSHPGYENIDPSAGFHP